MIENDSRTSRFGISIGDKVNFRWNAVRYCGSVIRLTRSKVVIRIGRNRSMSVSYRQVEQSTRYEIR